MAGILSSLLTPRRGGFASQHEYPSFEASAGQQKPGILSRIASRANQIGDELLMPTTGLGRLGAYLGAVSGGELGQASMLAMKDERQRGDAKLDEEYKRAQIARALRPETFAPRYFESNNGDQYMIGQNGQPQRVFKDPTPKTDWQWVKNPDGTMMGMPVPIGGIPAPQWTPVPDLPEGFTMDKPEGGAGSGQRPFR